jgi:undecaprenyl-diphosphatase
MPTFPPIIESLDRSLLLLVNGAHTPVLDTIMWSLTNALTWIGLFIAETFLSVKFYRKRFWMILLTLALSIGLTDQISSHIIKPVVKRPRPTHNVEIQDQIHCHQYADGSEYRGGEYGFVSSHAANSGTSAILIYFFFAPFFKKKIILTSSLLFFVLVFCYTRMYLGVHYPLDILGGWLLSICLCMPVVAYFRQHPVSNTNYLSINL